MRIFVAFAALLLAAPSLAQDNTNSFYILMQDTGSAKMLDLDTVAGGPANTSVMVLDVFSEPKTALLQTLEFNCPKGTYAVIRKMMATPDKPAIEITKREPSHRVPMGSQLAFVANLVCSGQGNLERNKVVHGALTDIIHGFWQKK